MAKLNKVKNFKKPAALCREFQSLSHDKALSSDCWLVFICALENRVRQMALISLFGSIHLDRERLRKGFPGL